MFTFSNIFTISIEIEKHFPYSFTWVSYTCYWQRYASMPTCEKIKLLKLVAFCALHDCWYSPHVACLWALGDCGKCVIDPVDHHDACLFVSVLSEEKPAITKWDPPKFNVDNCMHTKRPREDFGLNSAWMTGTVELTKPIPMPLTMRATSMCGTW